MPDKSKEKVATPGEKLAVIEEFDSGEGTYSDSGEIRSLTFGEPVFDIRKRRVNVKPAREMDRVPRVGDKILGVVETAQGNNINVRIDVINERYSKAGFTGMLQIKMPTYPDRSRARRVTVCKPGDAIRAEVFSNLNSIIHLAIDSPDEGVLCTVCSICGGKVVRVRNRIKCIECGNLEDRKLASDFG